MKDKESFLFLPVLSVSVAITSKTIGIFKSGEGVGGRRRGKEEEGQGGKKAKSGRRKKRKKSTKKGRKTYLKEYVLAIQKQ